MTIHTSLPLVVSGVRSLVVDHLGVTHEALDHLPVVTAQVPNWRHVILQAALEDFLDHAGVEHRVVGVPVEGFFAPTLAELLQTEGYEPGPIDYVRLPSGPDSHRACIRTGLVLTESAGAPVVAWLRAHRDGQTATIAVEVTSSSVEASQAFLADVRTRMEAHNPYRGHSLQVSTDRAGQVSSIEFVARPHVERAAVVLQPGVLDAIEAHAVEIGKTADRLRAAGRHLKRGLLLHGPPGTGKTHTVRYIASCLPDATLFVLTGFAMGRIETIASLLAEMAPAIVVLDDVDLIAEDRSTADNAGATLFDLLNAMDGIREDVDVLFVCTSNRADSLEQAISSRPGRIDQAIEIPLPDADCRRRLLELYGQGLDLRIEDLDAVLRRTEGVTASFVREMLRRAALFVLDEDEEAGTDGQPPDRELVVHDRHLHAALDQLLDPNHPLYHALLGIHEPASHEADGERSKQRGAGTAWCGI